MEPLVFAAALASAILHAVWNATVKNARDAEGAMAATVVVSGIACLPLLVVLPLPPPAAWPWIALAVVASNGALRFLTMAYERGAFALAYPIARGLSPLLVATAGIALFGDRPSLGAVGGIALVSIGIGILALQARAGGSLAAVGLATASAACLATVTVSDSTGVRLSPSLLGYAALVCTLNAVTFAIRPGAGGLPITALIRRHLVPALTASALSMTSYLLVLWAFVNGPTAPVAALRETSVVFATLLASVWLRERIGAVRWSAVALVAAGAIALRLA